MPNTVPNTKQNNIQNKIEQIKKERFIARLT